MSPTDDRMRDLADDLARDLAPAHRAEKKKQRAERDAKKRPRRPRWVPLVMASGIITLSAAAIFSISHGSSNARITRLIDRASAQVAQGAHEQADALLASAVALQPGASARARIAEMRVVIEAQRAHANEERTLADATESYHRLLRLQKVYVGKAAPAQPAVREFVRAVDRWLEQYGAAARLRPEHAEQLHEVEGLRERFAPQAHLDRPDGAADVMFQARAKVRVTHRRYREAIALIDEFIAASPADPARDELVSQRAKLVADSDPWLDRYLHQVDRLIDVGSYTAADDEVSFLERHGLPEWQPRVSAARERLTKAR